MTLSIKDYMLNIIAGRSIIGGLYGAIDNARRIYSIGGNYSYTFSLDNIGSKRYNMCELLKLDETYRCISLDEIALKETLTLDDMIIILLKGRNEFRNLYTSYYRAEDARINAKTLCYTFTNPYNIVLNKVKIQMNLEEVISLFNNAKNIIFDASLIYF